MLTSKIKILVISSLLFFSGSTLVQAVTVNSGYGTNFLNTSAINCDSSTYTTAFDQNGNMVEFATYPEICSKNYNINSYNGITQVTILELPTPLLACGTTLSGCLPDSKANTFIVIPEYNNGIWTQYFPPLPPVNPTVLYTNSVIASVIGFTSDVIDPNLQLIVFIFLGLALVSFLVYSVKNMFR
jgi:hypothetical protein